MLLIPASRNQSQEDFCKVAVLHVYTGSSRPARGVIEKCLSKKQANQQLVEWVGHGDLRGIGRKFTQELKASLVYSEFQVSHSWAL